MKRIDIWYGGEHYSVGGRTLDEVKREISEGLAAGGAWLRANDGEGAPRPALLLISPGVPIAVIPIPDDSPGAVGSEPLSENGQGGTTG